MAESAGSFLGGIPKGLLGAIGGLGSGVFSMKNFWNGALLTAGLTAIKSVAPEIYGSVLRFFSGEEAVRKASQEIRDEGFPSIVKSSLKEGFGIASAWNGAAGMTEAGSGGVGTMIGAGITMATVLAVTVGAVHHYNAADARTTGAAPQTPPKPAAAADVARAK